MLIVKMPAAFNNSQPIVGGSEIGACELLTGAKIASNLL